MPLIYLATFLFSLTMGALIMPRIVSISQKKNLMDAPDGRKVHPIPVPRLGGISFLPLTMMSVFLFNILCMTVLGAEVKAGDTSTFLRIQCCGMGAMLLYLVGAADDLVGVDYRLKFLAQTAAAALFPLSGLTFGSLFTAVGWIHVPFQRPLHRLPRRLYHQCHQPHRRTRRARQRHLHHRLHPLHRRLPLPPPPLPGQHLPLRAGRTHRLLRL